MTNEEALKVWLPIIEMGVKDMQECQEALHMAIEALKADQCEDCISRQAVKDIMVRWRFRDENAWRIADVEIEKLPPVTPAQKWIPVSERLPKDSADVLATDGQLIFIAWYEDKERTGWYSVDKFYNPYTPILAWMPLSEPYKEVEDENND